MQGWREDDDKRNQNARREGQAVEKDVDKSREEEKKKKREIFFFAIAHAA